MKHILLVDDVSTNLKCEGLILEGKYKITMVKSGREALAFFKTEIPDLVLLDIYMDEIDGYEVLECMKAAPETAEIPVILLTADNGKKSKERGMALGAVDFIRKPVEPQMLLDRIEALWKTEE